MNRGELDLALRFAEDLLCLDRQRNDATGLALAHQSPRSELVVFGRFPLSRSHLEEVLALYDPISERWVAHQVGTNKQVASQAFLANVLFCLGYPDQALAASNTAIANAWALAHPPSLALGLSIGSRLLSPADDNGALDAR